jgi:hypothetical protein
MSSRYDFDNSFVPKSAFENDEFVTSKALNDYDKCVLCGCVSRYKVGTPIDVREGYVEGVGQLCGFCK